MPTGLAASDTIYRNQKGNPLSQVRLYKFAFLLGLTKHLYRS